jgi:hypothetical protein
LNHTGRLPETSDVRARGRLPVASPKATISENVQKFLGKSDWKSAIAEMEKLFALDPDPMVRVRIGDAYQKLGQKADAVKQYIHAADLKAFQDFISMNLNKIQEASRMKNLYHQAYSQAEGYFVDRKK